MKKTIILAVAFAALTMGAGMAAARHVALDVSLANPLLRANESHRVFLKVGLTGLVRPDTTRRAPVNIALVIDQSGSMQGERIRQAKEAAISVVNRLQDNDVVSVVTFDSVVNVLVPATRASNRDSIRRSIAQIRAGGSTALHAGVSKGAAEVRKFIDLDYVNRVVLLSDGQANVGPRTAGALGELGASLMKEGIAVTTIGLGLGYNEDLMVRLARESDGNHAFVEHSDDLVAIFDREFGEATSVVALDVEIRIQCADSVRPIRVLGRGAEISGQTIFVSLNRIVGGAERYVMLEMEVPGRGPDETIPVAGVTASYHDVATGRRDELSGSVKARFTISNEDVERSVNREVMTEAVMQIGAETSGRAVRLRDDGRVEEARQLLIDNSAFLREQARTLDSDRLNEYSEKNVKDAEDIVAPQRWLIRRKSMRDEQYSIESQQVR